MSDHESEQQQLTYVYGKLVAAKSNFSQILIRENKEGKNELKNSSEDIRINFDNFADSLDTYAAIEMKNREIDQRNFSIQSIQARLAKIQRLLQSPYFGKVTVKFAADEAAESFYIGINGFADEDNHNLIYDWRSPIAELFYNNQLGKSSYEANGREVAVDIQKRRQLVTEKDQLKLVFDTAVTINDSILLEVLQQDAATTMKDITASIQAEQNVIIRDQTSPVLLVNGVAGSGKTSVIMQRIAYLLYRHRQEITADNVLILSPNEDFIHYISEVLPTLGEQNPVNLTFRHFMQKWETEKVETEEDHFERIMASAISKQDQILRSQEFFAYLKEKGNEVLLGSEPPFSAIKFKHKTLISAETIRRFYQQTPQELNFAEKIQATKQQLERLWQQTLQHQSLSPNIQDQLLLLSEEEQLHYFGQLMSDETELSVYAKEVLQQKYQSVTVKIAAMKWLNVPEIAADLYKEYAGKVLLQKTQTLDLQLLSLFVQHLFVEKLTTGKIAYLFMDEIQDYTPAQIYFIAELFPRAKKTMVGDENQAIFNANITFAEIEQIFSAYRLGPKVYHLQKSYRSTGAITALFSQLRSEKKQEILAIQPAGKLPVFTAFQDLAEFRSLVEDAIMTLDRQKLTIITKTRTEAQRLSDYLEQTALGNKVDIYSVSRAKGLEFDHVLLFDVSEENFCTAQDQRLLYTAVSRAMKTLQLTYRKTLTPFLTEIQKS